MSRMSLDQAMELARQHVVAQNFQAAEQICRQVLAVNPNHSDALHILGAVAMNLGKFPVAVELLRRALALNPTNGDIHYNLGVALIRGGHPAEAAREFREAMLLKPDYLPARANLAATLVAMHRYQEGIEVCRSTLAIAPDHPDAWNNLGVALQKLGRIEEAIVAFDRSVAARPDSVETISNLGNNLAKVKRFEEAIAAHQRVVALRPNVAELYNDLGCAQYDAGRYEDAIETFRSAMVLKPDYAQAQCTLAISLHRAGRFDEAIAEGRKAMRLWPDSDLPRFNLGMFLLLRGEWEEGLALNESRLGVPDLQLPRPVVGRPLWDGSDLNGQTIVLYGEQGLGDFLQFIRYIPFVRQRGGRIILGCAPEMIRVARQIEGVERLVSSAREGVQFDTHCPLLSLPHLFKTTIDTIPSSGPYLKADPELVAKWKSRMPEDPALLKIGICWQGRPTHGDDRNRSMKLAMLTRLWQIDGTWFCSLQKGEAAAQAKAPPAGTQIADFSDEVEDFADTAALIENMDLVITVDTSVAHLAGAMGKPTWILLPYVPDWRWLLERSDSPWYHSVRLFRQPKLRDWPGAVDQLMSALGDAVRQKGG